MALETALVTAEEFKQIANDAVGLAELVRGEVRPLHRPKMKHGCVCGKFQIRLGVWAETSEAGRVFPNDTGIVTHQNPDSVRGPDVFYISFDRLPDGDLPNDRWIEVPPEVCVEVLSPTDRWQNVHDKINEYLQFGVDEAWIADPELQQLTIYSQQEKPRLFRGEEEVTSGVMHGFRCKAEDCFRGC